jgi:cytochrome c oxidase subunit 1
MGWDMWNLLETVGAFIIGLSFLIFAYNIIVSRKNICHDPDPWDARTIEWGTSSPPPVHNFDEIPIISHLDEWWHHKYREDDNHRLVRIEGFTYYSTPEGPAEPPHLPSPSYWPLVCALGLPFVAWGLLYSYWLCAFGALLVLVAIYGWSLEPSVDPAGGHDGHDDHHHEPEPDPEPVAVATTPEGAAEETSE